MNNKCTEIKNWPLIKIEENNRIAVFNNPEKSDYAVSIIDDCLVTDGLRADYLVTKRGVASVIVELKGCDLKKACDQLLASAEHSCVKPLLEEKIGFLVICKRYPRFNDHVRKAKEHCNKRYKAGFHVACDKRTVEIMEICKINGSI